MPCRPPIIEFFFALKNMTPLQLILKLPSLLTNTLAAVFLSVTLASALFANTTADTIQNAIDAKPYLKGKLTVVSFENGLLTLSGWINEGLELEAIGSTLRKIEAVEKYTIGIVLTK